MTTDAAREFIKKYPGAWSFVKPSHLEELSPLLEVQIEAVEVRKDEFHELEGGKTYAPKKETLDKFAQAAGINYNTAAETTRKEGEGCYVGTTQGMVLGPDGKWQMGAVCEYEFDVAVRLEESKLNGKADWDNKDAKGRPGKRQHTDQELALERVGFLKVGRQRANTGARSRATLVMLGMQTGFKGLFSKDTPDSATKTFLFSRIIVNAKNEMVAQAMLSGIQGNAGMLFGPQAGRAIAAPEIHAAPTEAPRRVGPDAGDDFTPAASDFEAEPDPNALKMATLADLLDKYPTYFLAKGIERGRAAVASKNMEEVEVCLKAVRDVLVRAGILQGVAS